MKRLAVSPGDRFNCLTVQRELERGTCQRAIGRSAPFRRIECVCDCGKTIAAKLSALVSGHTKSCGCLKTERQSTKRPEYHVLMQMLERCSNPNSLAYKNYGGRGITVCDRWQKFSNFYEDMGARPSPLHSIDRIDNNDGYHPLNCRWATSREQRSNTRRNRMMTFNGETRCVAEWARLAKRDPSTLLQHLKKGKTDHEILSRYFQSHIQTD